MGTLAIVIYGDNRRGKTSLKCFLSCALRHSLAYLWEREIANGSDNFVDDVRRV